ncbi:MAG: hypothetical protein JXA46_02910 [Dehalococcoidales bacterium]|nr:hypothetical protein [Dehalococcoidales bacterium]
MEERYDEYTGQACFCCYNGRSYRSVDEAKRSLRREMPGIIKEAYGYLHDKSNFR